MEWHTLSHANSLITDRRHIPPVSYIEFTVDLMFLSDHLFVIVTACPADLISLELQNGALYLLVCSTR